MNGLAGEQEDLCGPAEVAHSDLQGDLTCPLTSVCVAETDDKLVQSSWHPTDFTFVTTSANKTATLWAMPTE